MDLSLTVWCGNPDWQNFWVLALKPFSPLITGGMKVVTEVCVFVACVRRMVGGLLLWALNFFHKDLQYIFPLFFCDLMSFWKLWSLLLPNSLYFDSEWPFHTLFKRAPRAPFLVWLFSALWKAGSSCLWVVGQFSRILLKDVLVYNMASIMVSLPRFLFLFILHMNWVKGR